MGVECWVLMISIKYINTPQTINTHHSTPNIQHIITQHSTPNTLSPQHSTPNTQHPS